MKNYDKKVFEKLVLVVRNDDVEAEKWLDDNGHRELREFWDACENVEKSFKWLLDNGFRQLAAAADAMHGNDQAKLYLISSGNRELAAFIEACTGSQKAINYLLKSGYPGWVVVAKEIHFKEKKESKSIWSIFSLGNPFR